MAEYLYHPVQLFLKRVIIFLFSVSFEWREGIVLAVSKQRWSVIIHRFCKAFAGNGC